MTNVDSQVSGDNIVIQVVGAMSNNSQPSRKFVQTFVLAAQTNGYFVLNDIFRYLFDEDEEAAPENETPELTQVTGLTAGFQEPVPTVEESEQKGLTSSTDPAAQEHDASIVDKELEQVLNEESIEKETPNVAVNGTPEEESKDDASTDDVADAEASKTEPAEEAAQAEKPKDLAASPVVPVKDAQKPVSPAKPAVPRTWAQLAGLNSKPAAPAAAAAAAPVAAATTTPSTAAQAKPSQPPQASVPSVPAPIATTPPVREPSPAEGSQEGSTGGWQPVGPDHKRQQSRSQTQPAGDSDRVRAYVRNVYGDVSPDELKNTLQKFGPIPYCDINRQKVPLERAQKDRSVLISIQNSAFVEFSTRAGFAAAVAANPHKIAGHEIFVEERRVNAFPSNRGNTRGSRQSFDGRTAGQGRGGTFNKDSSRGNFAARGRGGTATPRGRGTAA